MTAPRISLAQQIEAVRFAETRQRTIALAWGEESERREAIAKAGGPVR